MSKYHISARGKIARCRAKGQCPLGGSAMHYSPDVIAMVSEKTYTPIKELRGADVEQYITQEGLNAPFKDKKPGQDITDSYPVPLINHWASNVPLTSLYNVRKVVVVDQDKYFILVDQGASKRQVTGWLVQDQGRGPVPIGMINLMERKGDKYPYSVMSVEVRPEYRGQGLAKKIAFGANTVLDGEIYSAGQYTPSGHQRLQGLFKPKDEQDTGPREVAFDDMNFIDDWDNFVPPE